MTYLAYFPCTPIVRIQAYHQHQESVDLPWILFGGNEYACGTSFASMSEMSWHIGPVLHFVFHLNPVREEVFHEDA